MPRFKASARSLIRRSSVCPAMKSMAIQLRPAVSPAPWTETIDGWRRRATA